MEENLSKMMYLTGLFNKKYKMEYQQHWNVNKTGISY